MWLKVFRDKEKESEILDFSKFSEIHRGQRSKELKNYKKKLNKQKNPWFHVKQRVNRCFAVNVFKYWKEIAP